MSNKELIKISASSVKTFDQCPKKYFYTYIDKVPRKHWDHFDLGNICHKTLEIFHKVYMNKGISKHKSLSGLMGYAFKEARKEFKLNNSIIAEAKDLLAGYLKRIKLEGVPLVKGVEISFNINLEKDLVLRGFLDRLDILKDGKFRIIDYKTTKNEKYLDDFQLLIYGLWICQEYPSIESFDGAYILLRHDSKLKDYNFNLHDVERIRKKLINYADKIRGEKIWPKSPSFLCNWCDFRDICEGKEEASGTW